ncbi:MAG: hypothetical protein WA432_00355 [Candidatus Babeliaceae bacterium]
MHSFKLSYADTIIIQKMNDIGEMRYSYCSKTVLITPRLVLVNQAFCKKFPLERFKAIVALEIAGYAESFSKKHIALLCAIPVATFLIYGRNVSWLCPIGIYVDAKTVIYSSRTWKMF